MPTFKQTEITKAQVTTIRTVEASCKEEAEVKFDNGEYDSIEEHVEDVFSVISSKIEEVYDPATAGKQE